MISIIFDTETTGLDPLNDRIVEIATIITDWHTVYAALHTRINPTIVFDNPVNGLSNSDTKDSPTFEQLTPILAPLFAFADEFVAFNYPFDANFLREELARCGLRFPRRAIYDPMKILGRRKLREHCATHGIFCDDIDWHTAFGDTLATFRLAAKLKAQNKESVSVDDGPLTLGPRFQ